MDVYRQAAEVIKAVRAGEGTAKALCLRKEMQKKKQTYAVVCETLRHYELIEDVLQKAAFFEYYPQASKDLSVCMAYDAVIGKGVNTKNDTTARAVAESVKYLRDAYMQVRKHHRIVPRSTESMDTSAFEEGEGTTGGSKRPRAAGADADGEEEAMASGGVSVRLPRYARVNTLKIDTETLVQRLRNAAEEKRKKQQETSKPGRILPSFTLDPVIPDLLVFPTGTDLHAHPAVRGGQLVLQDRASCLPPCVLLDAVPVTLHTTDDHAAKRKPLQYVVDACAAPGNKTTQLAALGAPAIRIMALELDERRAGLLEHRVQVLGAGDYVNVNHLDFFNISSEHREATEGILLDPSCSASGVLSRVDIEVGVQSPAATSGGSHNYHHHQQQEQQQATDEKKDQAGEKEIIFRRERRRLREKEELQKPLEEVLPTISSTSPATGKRGHTVDQRVVREIAEKKRQGQALTLEEMLMDQELEEEKEQKAKQQEQAAAAAASATTKEEEEATTTTTIAATEETTDAPVDERVVKLSHLQRKLLAHALLSFPNCRTVVYSTCSIHETENEDVVRQVLDDTRVQERGWQLSEIMPGVWPSRGHRRAGEAHPLQYTVRCDPAVDRTNGFYVARFDRVVAPAAKAASGGDGEKSK